MITLKLGENTYELATSLRVVYALKDMVGAKNLQEAMAGISRLDLDGQMDLLYAAYKAGSGRENPITKSVFIDAIIDNLGVFAITNTINSLTEGLLYSGLSPEEIASKKAEAEKIATTAGPTSSVKVIG